MIDLLVDAERRPLRPPARAARARVCIGRPGRVGVLLPVVRRQRGDGSTPTGRRTAIDRRTTSRRSTTRRRRLLVRRPVGGPRADGRDQGVRASTRSPSRGGGGLAEDLRLPAVIAAARRSSIAVAIHIEPYRGRTVASVVADIGHLHDARDHDVLRLPGHSTSRPPNWAPANDALRAEGARCSRRPRSSAQAAAGHFSGLYTYDIVTYGGGKLARLCNQAHAVGLLCAPRSGPGTTRGGRPATRTSSRAATG